MAGFKLGQILTLQVLKRKAVIVDTAKRQLCIPRQLSKRQLRSSKVLYPQLNAKVTYQLRQTFLLLLLLVLLLSERFNVLQRDELPCVCLLKFL